MEQENLLNENEEKETLGENNSQKETPNLPQQIYAGKTPNQISKTTDNIYEEYLKGQTMNLPPWLAETNKEERKIEVLPQELYMYLKKNDHIISVKLGNSRGITLYHYEDGYYKLWSECDCKAYIKSYIPTKIRNSSQWEKVYKEFITDYANTDESQLNANENIINFQNGTLDLTTEKLLPHSPDDLCTIQIPCKYFPNLPLSKAEVTFKYLTDLTNGNTDDLYTLLEFIGAIISNVKVSRFKKLLILVGPGDTGKSKIREFAELLVGKENCHTVSINQMTSKFGLGGIYGKRLIGDGDMEISRVAEIDILKQLTGDDSINVEMKYQNATSTKYNGAVWFNCNKLPSFGGDKGAHVYERFLILSCDNVIPKNKQNALLLDDMLKEREVIVSVAVRFLIDAIKRGHRFTESKRTQENRIKYQIENDSLTLFLKQCCIPHQGRTNISYFKYKYKEWCKENNLVPERPNSITDILVNDFGIIKGKSGTDYYELEIKED